MSLRWPASLVSLLLLGHGALGQGIPPTPSQSLGPYYPVRIPPDSDPDLTSVAGAGRKAEGQPLLMSGRVLGPDGTAIPGAKVEIWQTDAKGRYSHPRAPDSASFDPGFQGYGQTITDAEGRYSFRTVRPMPYPGRTPHIHVLVTTRDGRRLVTQMYLEGEPGNARDALLGSLDPAARASLIVPLTATAEPGVSAARFDIVLARR